MPPKLPFVIHCFVPVSRQPSPSRSARVRSERASEPEPDSVSANAPIFSPRASGGTSVCACSSVPNWTIGSVARARVHGDRDADPRVGAGDLLEHEHVGEEVGAGAAQLLGDADAHEPELGELRHELVREAVLAIPLGRACGAISASANSRATAWISRCSGESSKSTRRRIVSKP